MVRRGREPLVRLEMFGNRQFTGGLLMFFFQFLVQAGLFFTIPLYLSVALGLSAIDTGLRIMPLSITLLIAAAGIPRFFPNASPRRVVRLGLLAMSPGIVSLFSAHDLVGRSRDRDRPAAPRGARDRRARLAAGQRHGLGRAGRRERRGRRSAEHRDEPRRVPGHGAGRLDPHRHADVIVPHGHRRERRRSRRRVQPRRASSWRPASRSCRTRTSRRSSRRRA